MRTALVIALVLSVPACGKFTVTDSFLDALEHIESGGDRYAMGDFKNGLARAVGCLQLWKIYVDEANRISGKDWQLIDRKYPDRSRAMTRTVLTYWAEYHQRRGIRITPAVLASLHRRPCAAWSPEYLKEETKRTEKLLKYMKEGD
jgi:hypothetical protein